jgi:hypothetical protein
MSFSPKTKIRLMYLEVVCFGWPVLPDVRKKRDIVLSEEGQEKKKMQHGGPYIEG